MSFTPQQLEQAIREVATKWLWERAGDVNDQQLREILGSDRQTVNVQLMPSPRDGHSTVTISMYWGSDWRMVGFDIDPRVMRLSDDFFRTLLIQVGDAMSQITSLYGGQQRDVVRTLLNLAEQISWGHDLHGQEAESLRRILVEYDKPAKTERLRQMLLVAGDMALEDGEEQIGGFLQKWAGGVQ